VAQPFDIAGIDQVTEALIQQGFTPEQIRLIMGENTLRVLRQNLP
jgi:microsomal dipeptidase-like Zn-dependent dipeptidase